MDGSRLDVDPRTREALLGLVLDSAPMGVALLRRVGDGDGLRFVYVNAAFQALRPFSAMLGRSFVEVWQEVDDPILPRMREVLLSGEPWHGSFTRFVNGDFRRSERRYVYDASRLEGGGEPFILLVVQDVQAMHGRASREEERRSRLQYEQLETSELLLRTAADLATAKDATAIGDLVAAVLAASPRHTRVRILERTEGNGGLVLVAGMDGASRIEPAGSFGEESFDRSVIDAAGHGRPVVHGYSGPLIPDARLVLHVPLMRGDRWIGLIMWDEPATANDFTGEEIRLAEGVASQAALAFEDARLFQEQQRSATVASALADIAATLAAAHDVDVALTAVLGAACRVLGAAGAIIADRVEGGWKTRQAVGATTEEIGEFHSDEMSPARSEASRTRRPYLLSDVLEHDTLSFYGRLGFRSYVAYPLIFRNEVVAAASFFFAKPRESLATWEANFLERFAYAVSSGLENARLLSAEVATRDRLEVELETTRLLLQVAQALGGRSSLDEVLRTLADIAVRMTGHSRASVHLLQDDHTVTLAAQSGPGALTRGSTSTVESLPDQLIELLRSGGSTVIDFEPVHDFNDLGDPGAVRRALVTTLAARKGIIGFIALHDPGDAATFPRRDVELLEGIAAQASVAIENTRLLEGERNRSRLTETLNGIQRMIYSMTDGDALLQQSLQAAVRAMRADWGIMFVADGDELLARHVIGSHSLPIGSRVARDEVPWIREAMTTGEPVVIEDADRDPRAGWPENVVRRQGARSMVAIPLRATDETVGAICLDFEEPHPFSDAERDFAEGIGSSISIALEKLRLFSAEKDRRRRIEALHGVTEVAVSAFDPAKSAEQVLRYLVEQHGFESASVRIVKSGRLELLADYGLPPVYRERFFSMALDGPMDAAKVLRTQRAIVAQDASEADPAVLGTYRDLGIPLGAYVVLPLRSRAKVIGTLVFSWSAPRVIDASSLTFYSSIASQLGVILENAQLYQSEHTIADRLQEALLSLADIPGVESAHAYRSAAEAARVGGDFYDLFEIEHRRVGVTIGDVAGKGLDAAALTSLVKNTIRAHATSSGSTPSKVLSLTNDVVYRTTSEESFVTVLFGVLDLENGTFVYANGGHTTAAVVRPGTGVYELPSSGSVVGAFPDVDVVTSEIRMEPDEMLFLYTDGLTEARYGRDQYGEERLFKVLRTVTGAPEAVIATVMDDVMTYTHGSLSDDLAILCIRRSTDESDTSGA